MKMLTMILVSFSLSIAACDNSVDEMNLSESDLLLQQIDLLPSEPLSDGEVSALLFMREEEKLARDVYQYLYEIWGARPFANISGSEQKHMDAVLRLITKYKLNDPVGDNQRGVFANTILQQLYDELTKQGAVSLEEAFIVGAVIEEIDIVDLKNELETNVDNQDIILVFENLMKGSRNHLRSFISNLTNLNVTYVPQYLSQQDYDAIINSDMERGGRNGRRN